MIKTIQDNTDVFTINSKTKIFDVKAMKNDNSYPVRLHFPSSKIYSSRTLGIIDTGAANSAITIKALFDNITPEQYNILMTAGSRTNAYRHSFSSVGAANNIVGMLCILPSIRINGYIINDFPFYLIDNIDIPNALIGYDFISSCDVIQRQDQEMSFYNFDINSMWSKMRSRNALNLLNLK